MAVSSRSLVKVVEYYRAGVRAFVGAGLAPPPSALTSGQLSLEEAMPRLLDLHKSALERVSNDTDRVLPKALRKVGPPVVYQALFENLADVYGISARNLHDAEAMARSGTEILADNQPMLDGDYDIVLLRSESEEALNERAD